MEKVVDTCRLCTGLRTHAFVSLIHRKNLKVFLQIRILFPHILLDQVTLVADDQHDAAHTQRYDVVEDVRDDGFSRDVEQRLGERIGVRA